MKWLIATVSIAVGVGLGFAVHLIHKQALDQFNNPFRVGHIGKGKQAAAAGRLQQTAGAELYDVVADAPEATNLASSCSSSPT